MTKIFIGTKHDRRAYIEVGKNCVEILDAKTDAEFEEAVRSLACRLSYYFDLKSLVGV